MAHRLRSLSGERFGIEVYGFDHYVSYLYPGGLAVRSLKGAGSPR